LHPLQQRLAQRLFQPLDLQTDRGLRPAKLFGRNGETALFNNRDKSAQGIEIEMAERHRANLFLIHINNQ
jgi:hypothetical protein